MALAQTEVARRRLVRTMLERLGPESQEPVERSLYTRQELFGQFPNRTEEGFQQRLLVRMCKTGVLDSLILHPTRMRVYAVRDSSKVLDALTDDEALTRLIWHRPEVPDLSQFVPESAPAESAPTPPTQTGVTDGQHATGVLAELQTLAENSDEGLQAMTLKLLAGMLENLVLLRVKIEAIDQKIDQLTQGSP